MRKYHRWLALLFGALLLFIAGTGLVIQALDIFGDPPARPAGQIAGSSPEGTPQSAGVGMKAEADDHDADAHDADAHSHSPDEAGAPSQRKGPPRPKGLKGFITHLHSGEYFGPIGTALSIASGFALLFFAFSGLWMYVQMFRARKGSTAGKFFW